MKLSELTKKIDKRLDDFVDEFNEMLTAEISANTPVYDSGREFFYKQGEQVPIIPGELLGSWSVGINAFASPGPPTEDKVGKAAELAAQAKAGEAGDVFYYTNDAPYAAEVEYNITPEISDMTLKPTSPQFTRRSLDKYLEFVDMAIQKVKQ